MKRPIVFCGLFFLGAVRLQAAPLFQLGLKDAETAALIHSPRFQAAQADAEAAHARARSQFASLWPKLSFDASYRYVSEVPSFSPIPNVPPIKFGDNKNYSYGPTLNWLAFNSGGDLNRWKSAQASWRSKQKDVELAQKQILLETRLDYFQVQLGLEQVRLLVDSLKLAQAQYKDIHLRTQAGVSSRLDSLSAHQEVLERRRLLRQAQADLANALQTLYAVTGSPPPADSSIPIDKSVSEPFPPDTDAPTLAVGVDPLSSSQAGFGTPTQWKFDTQHPQLVSLSDQIHAGELSLESVKSGHYPFLQVTARTSRDYPNGPVLESIHQNTIGLSASLPIFEFGRVSDNVTEQKSLVSSLQHRRAQTAEDLERDWQKARDQWQGLAAQQPIYQDSIKETETIQKLTYEAYKAGERTFLEVEDADLRVLESKVASARNDVQLLIQLALLDSLSTKE